MRLRVLQIVEPGRDGVFRHVEGLIEHLLEHEVQVDLAYSSRRSSKGLLDLIAKVTSRGGQVLDLKVKNAPGPADLLAIWRLWRMVKATRPQVIHSHSSKAGALGRFLRLLGCRGQFIYTPNAYYGLAREKGFLVRVYNWIETVLGRIGWTINVSEDEAVFARERLNIPARRQVVIANPVKVNHFQPATSLQKAAARSQFGLPEQATVLGTSARFSWQKDPHTLYSALTQVMPEYPELYFLHLSSGGELEAGMHELVRKQSWARRVVFFPYLDDPLTFYQALDGFTLTSRYEGFPFVAVEAMAMNLPLVFTRFVGGSQLELLGLNRYESAPVGDVLALADSLRQLLKRLPQSTEGINHRQIAQEFFDQKICYEKVRHFYNETLLLSS